MAAFERALELQVDGLDTDVRFTSDDVPVLFHDATLKSGACWHKEAGALPLDVPVRTLRWKELADYDCQFLKSQPIARLEDLFALMQAGSQPLSLEIKSTGPKEYLPTPERAAEVVADLAVRYRMLTRIEPYSFNTAFQTALVQALEQRGGRAIVDIVPLPWQWVTPEALAELRSQGKRVVPWTVNDDVNWDSLRMLGVDGMNTDRPEALLRHLGRLR